MSGNENPTTKLPIDETTQIMSQTLSTHAEQIKKLNDSMELLTSQITEKINSLQTETHQTLQNMTQDFQIDLTAREANITEITDQIKSFRQDL